MSRRSQWESMRREARSRVDDIGSKSLLDTTPKSDSLRGIVRGSTERDWVKTRELGQMKRQSPGAKLRKEHDGKGPHSFEKAVLFVENDGYCNEKRENSLSWYHNHENIGFPVGTVEVPTASSPPCAASDEIAATFTNVVDCKGDSMLNDTIINPQNTDVFREGITNDIVVATGGASLRALQLELAQEKKKNIVAEQRIFALDKEVKAVRLENTRLLSFDNEGKSRLTQGVVLKNESAAVNDVSKTHIEQMVSDLQNELSLLKEYTKELETRLAEKSSALESCMCESDYKEQRIRQLERTIADEMILRCKTEMNVQNEKKNDVKFSSISGVQNEFVNKTSERNNIIRNTVVPSVIHCSTTFLKTQHEKEQQQQQQRDATHSDRRSKTIEENNLSPMDMSSISHLREASQHRSSSFSRHEVRNDKYLYAKGSKRSEQEAKSDRAKSIIHQSAGLSTPLPTGRASCLTSARKTAVSTRSSVNLRRVITTGTGVSAPPSRPSSRTRKKTSVKTTHHQRRSNSTRKSISPPPQSELMKETSLENSLAIRSPLSRRINRPPPIESSIASLSSAGAGMMHYRETRSCAQPPRSRPLIYHDGKGLTTVKTLGTTIITRSAKRWDSPTQGLSQRPESVEPLSSDHMFVSESLGRASYGTGKARQYCKGGSSSRSVSRS